MTASIANGNAVPINFKTGTVPDVSGALKDWFQPMIFTRLTKTVTGFEAVEIGATSAFQGIIQPFSARQLLLKPEGQRAWTWFTLHADPVLTLQVDDVVLYRGVQTRVMTRKNYVLYGYVEYEIVQDWAGAGP